jgi:MerR family transcriptional regulator, copper efflux regulator
VCSLTADQHGTRIQDWDAMLDGAHREGLPDGGIRIRLPIGRADQLARLVVAEQQCCPFFTFRLTIAGEHVELDAHAPDGAEALIKGLFDEQAAPC